MDSQYLLKGMLVERQKNGVDELLYTPTIRTLVGCYSHGVVCMGSSAWSRWTFDCRAQGQM